jgi:hypothetical protein
MRMSPHELSMSRWEILLSAGCGLLI